MKTEAHSHQWMWQTGQMDISFKRYPFGLLLGLSLAIHLLVLAMWPALQPKQLRLALPSADFSIRLQHNDVKTESIPTRPALNLATAPVSAPVLTRAKLTDAHEPRQTITKSEVTAKTVQAELTATTNMLSKTLRPSPASNFKTINDPAASTRNINYAGSPSGEHVRLKPHLQCCFAANSGKLNPPRLNKTVSGISQNRVISRLQLELKQYFYYPRLAQRKNIQGTVILGFAINPQGTLTNIRIVKSSGFAVLDMAAEDALQKLRQLDWDQDSDRRYLQRDNSNIKLPVIYRLTES